MATEKLITDMLREAEEHESAAAKLTEEARRIRAAVAVLKGETPMPAVATEPVRSVPLPGITLHCNCGAAVRICACPVHGTPVPAFPALPWDGVSPQPTIYPPMILPVQPWPYGPIRFGEVICDGAVAPLTVDGVALAQCGRGEVTPGLTWNVNAQNPCVSPGFMAGGICGGWANQDQRYLAS